MFILSGGIVSWFRLKACPKCHGDLASDDGDWLCLQCGTYYYTGLYGYAGANKAPRTMPGLDAGIQSGERFNSTPEPRAQDGPDHPPQREERPQERSMEREFVAAPVLTGAAPGLAPSTSGISPADITSSAYLPVRQQ